MNPEPVQDPLPGMPEPPPKRRARRRKAPDTSRPTWTVLRLARAPVCARCCEISYAARRWGRIDFATYRRTSGDDRRDLCAMHAEIEVRADRMTLPHRQAP